MHCANPVAQLTPFQLLISKHMHILVGMLSPLQGNDMRLKPRVWNKGDQLLKFLVLKSVRGGWERPEHQGQQQSSNDSSSTSITTDHSKEATEAPRTATATIAAAVP